MQNNDEVDQGKRIGISEQKRYVVKQKQNIFQVVTFQVVKEGFENDAERNC